MSTPAGELARLSAGLKDVREALHLDGADLEVLGLAGGVARLRLVVGPEACLECIMPKEVIEQMILHDVRATMPEVMRVTVDDPRATNPPP